LVLATQAVRAKAVPLSAAEHFDPGTLVVVVVGVVVVVVVVVVGFVVVVVAVDVVVAAEIVGARKHDMVASVAANAVTAAAPQP
jgi:hypothetical protein